MRYQCITFNSISDGPRTTISCVSYSMPTFPLIPPIQINGYQTPKSNNNNNNNNNNAKTLTMIGQLSSIFPFSSPTPTLSPIVISIHPKIQTRDQEVSSDLVPQERKKQEKITLISRSNAQNRLQSCPPQKTTTQIALLRVYAAFVSQERYEAANRWPHRLAIGPQFKWRG